MDIDVIKRRLLIKYPLFESVIVNLQFIEDKEIDTAETDGKNIYYNSSFVDTLNEKEQIFVFAHEICHIAFNHIYRSVNKDKNIWNITTDAVINAFLDRDGLPIINGGINIPEAINYGAEEIYKKLLKEKKCKKQENRKTNSNNENNSEFDKQMENKNGKTNSNDNYKNNISNNTHSMWENAINKKMKIMIKLIKIMNIKKQRI